MRLEFGHFGDDLFDVVHQHAFGEFQFQVLRVGPGPI